MFQVVSRSDSYGRTGPRDQAADGAAHRLPQRRSIAVVAAHAAELRQDISAWKAQGNHFEARRASDELRMVARELDRLMAGR